MIVEFEGQRHEFPDDFTDAEVQAALDSLRPAAASAEPPAAVNPRVAEFGTSPEGRTPATSPNARALTVGIQGAGAGLVELAAMPFDLAAGAQNILVKGINKAFGTEIPMAKPASAIAKDAAAAGAEAVGIPVIDYDTMSPSEKAAYNVNRFGAQAAGAVPALTRAAASRSAEIASGSGAKWYDSFIRPYLGDASGRTVAGDAAAAAGSGLGVTAAETYLPEGVGQNPAVQTGAALAGGVGGVGALGLIEGLIRRGAAAIGKPFGANIDRGINVDPETGMPVTKVISDRAAAVVQNEAVDPAAAAARIRANEAELRGLYPDAPIPSPAGLSEDPGLAGLERKVRAQDTGAAIARDREFNTKVRDTVDAVAPEGATPSALVQRVQRVADARTDVAQKAVDQAEGRARGVEMSRVGEAEASVRPFEGRGPGASQRLDETIVDQGYVPARAEKNRQFDAAPGRNDQLPADEVIAAAEDVRRRINQLRPDVQMPGEFVDILQRLKPVMSENARGEIENIGGPGTALGADLADTRKYLSTAQEKARASGNFDLADSIGTLKKAINNTLNNAPGYAEANANYRQFADTYRPSPNEPAAKFTRQLDRDPQRGTTPPSQTAGRFIQPGQPEKMDALIRMVEASADPASGQAAAREYLMADMASSGVVDTRTGVIRPDRLRQWQAKWGNLDNLVPGFQREIGDMTRRATRGEQLAGDFAAQTKAASKAAKQTQDDIDKGAFGLVLNSDPDKAVASIMDQTNRSGRLLGELINVTASDPQARNGLKAAVRDYLIDKATTGASEKLTPGDRRGPVSQAKLATIFKEHEKEMAQIFSPEEMNALRAGHKALELANIERLRVSSGSDTAEKVGVIERLQSTPLGKGIDAFLRLKYGVLKAGGLIATAKRLTAGLDDSGAAEVARLIERASVDPELMALLLGRKIPVASPAWNAKLNRIIGYAEGARDTAED